MRFFLLITIAVSAVGCIAQYHSYSELPPELSAELDRQDEYYINQATDNASFVTGCPKEQVSGNILTTTTDTTYLWGYNRIDPEGIYKGERGATIGVNACGKRLTYQIICGHRENYSPHARRSLGACKVVAEGSTAQTTMEQSNEEEAAEAERQSQLQQQQKQTK